MTHEVFVSHATPDRRAADRLCGVLEAAGIECWIAPRDVPPGATYSRAIVGAIADARVVVLVFSKDTERSEHVEREVEFAANQKDLLLLPVRIDGTEPDVLAYFLRTVQWIDAPGGPTEAHCRYVTDCVTAHLADAPRPAPPAARRRSSRALLLVGGLLVLVGGGLWAGRGVLGGGGEQEPSPGGEEIGREIGSGKDEPLPAGTDLFSGSALVAAIERVDAGEVEALLEEHGEEARRYLEEDVVASRKVRDLIRLEPDLTEDESLARVSLAARLLAHRNTGNDGLLLDVLAAGEEVADEERRYELAVSLFGLVCDDEPLEVRLDGSKVMRDAESDRSLLDLAYRALEITGPDGCPVLALLERARQQPHEADARAADASRLIAYTAEQDLRSARAADGASLVHLAAGLGRTELVIGLVDAGLGIEGTDHVGLRPLAHAAASGREETVRQLLAMKAVCCARDDNGDSPFDLAASADHAVIVELLAPLELERAGGQGYQPSAVQRVVAPLRRSERHAFLDRPDALGAPALHRALEAEWVELVVSLIELGASPSALDGESRTALHVAAEGGVAPLAALSNALGSERLEPLLRTTDASGCTPLHLAVRADRIANVRLLIRSGADVEAANHAGDRPLHWAADRADEDAASVLCKAEADVTALNGRSETPLHVAARGEEIEGAGERHEATMRVLLKAVTEESRADIDGASLASYAAWGGSVEILRMLRQRGLLVDPWSALEESMEAERAAASSYLASTELEMALEGDDDERLKRILGHARFENEWLEARDARGLAPVHRAIAASDHARALLLDERKPSVLTKDGQTPLEFALSQGRCSLAERLPGTLDAERLAKFAAAGGCERLVGRVLDEMPDEVLVAFLAIEHEGGTLAQVAASGGHEELATDLREQASAAQGRIDLGSWSPAGVYYAYLEGSERTRREFEITFKSTHSDEYESMRSLILDTEDGSWSFAGGELRIRPNDRRVRWLQSSERQHSGPVTLIGEGPLKERGFRWRVAERTYELEFRSGL